MKSTHNMALLVCVLLTPACHSPANNSARGQAEASFEVQIADLYTFNHQDKRAKSLSHRNAMWEFRGDRMLLRMAGRFDDEGETSLDLIYNNVFLQFNHVVDGKKVHVSCKPNHRPKGTITRTTQGDQTSSGTFRLEFERCRQTHTEQVINDFSLPLVVTGTFNSIAIKDALF